jgi:cytochrome o ubiquinol oxidase subunit 3
MMQTLVKKHGDGHSHDHEHGHEEHEQLKVLGFWIFLVTDCILFGSLFATYAVLMHNYAGGPTGKELFEMPGVIASTFILLTSSFTSGLAILAMNKGKVKELIGWLAVTAILGLAFIGLEITEFANGRGRCEYFNKCVSFGFLCTGWDAWSARYGRFVLDGGDHDTVETPRHNTSNTS